MWRAPDQELLSLQSNLLLQQQQQGTRSSHDSLFQRRHLGPQSTDCTRIQASEQHHDLPHGLQQALLSEAAQGPTADLPNMQLDLDNVTLATAVGFGSESVLAHFHRSLGDQARQSPSELNAVLAASLGGPENFANTVVRSDGVSISSHMLPQSTLDQQSSSHLHSSTSTIPHLRSDLGDIAESDNQSDEDEGSIGIKRKGPMTEEDKKRRRQEINRQSARRIRERRSQEMERLKQQNAALQQSQTLLLKYASTLAREKNVLVQRTLELTERWNQAAAENLELRGRVKSDPSAINSSTCHHNAVQAASQVMPPQLNGSDSKPTYAQ